MDVGVRDGGGNTPHSSGPEPQPPQSRARRHRARCGVDCGGGGWARDPQRPEYRCRRWWERQPQQANRERTPRPQHSVPSQVTPDAGPGSRRATTGLFPTLRTSGQGATNCAFPRGRPLHTYRRARRVSEVPGSAAGGLGAPRALPALILWAQALLAEPSQCFISCQSTGNSLPPQQAWEHTTPC